MFYVTHAAESIPSGLVAAEVMANELGIPTETLLSYATSGFCPHWRVNDGDPLFQKTEVRKWAAKNLLRRCDGKDFPERLSVITFGQGEIDMKDVPSPLLLMKNLQLIPSVRDISGVYFLCKNKEIVYIGQSKSIFKRVPAHTEKEYDSAYFIPAPIDSLNNIEGALIRFFRPKLNNGINEAGNGGAPRGSVPDLQTIKSIMVERPAPSINEPAG